MKTLHVNGETFEAVRIVKGKTYIEGFDDNGSSKFKFDNVKDFSLFTLSPGEEWDEPPVDTTGMIKLDETDTLGFLDDKLDTNLIINDKNHITLKPEIVEDIEQAKVELRNAKKRVDISNSVMYFSYSTGDDSNDGHLFSHPKKDVNAFLKSIEEKELYSNNNITQLTLRIIDNNPDDSSIRLVGIDGISLLIRSHTSIRTDVDNLSVINCENAITLTRVSSKTEIKVNNCRNVILSYTDAIVTKDAGFYITSGSKVFLEGCKATGSEDCLFVSDNSDVSTLNFSGTGTDTGITVANGSLVKVSGATIKGNKNNTVEITGGRVEYYK